MIVKKEKYKQVWTKQYRYIYKITSFLLFGFIPIFVNYSVEEAYKRV